MSNSNDKNDNNQNTLVGDPLEITNSAHLQNQIGFSHDLGALKQSHVDIQRSQERIEANVKNCVTIDQFKASAKVIEGLVANVDKLNTNVADIQSNVAVMRVDSTKIKENPIKTADETKENLARSADELKEYLAKSADVMKENQIKMKDCINEALKNFEKRISVYINIWGMASTIAMLMMFISNVILIFRTF